MATEIFIVIANTESDIDRRAIERIEGTHYKINYENGGYDKITAHKVFEHLRDNEFKSSRFNVFEMGEFTELVNNQDLDNLTDSFIGYVTAELIK